MGEHLNAKLYRRALQAFRDGDLDTMKGLIAADCEWYEAGNPAPTRGREAIIERFGQMTEGIDGDVEIVELLADDRGFVAKLDVHMRRGSDEARYTVLEQGHIEDGLLVERRSYMDAVPDSVARFFGG